MLTLVDTGNISHAIAKYAKGKEFDYKLFGKSIRGWKIAYGTDSPANKGFKMALDEYGYGICFRPVSSAMPYYNPIVDMVLDAISPKELIVNLVTSNIQILPLIMHLKDEGVKANIYAIKPHPLFITHASSVHYLEEYLHVAANTVEAI